MSEEDLRTRAIQADDPTADLHTDPDAPADGFMSPLEADKPWRVGASLLSLKAQLKTHAPNRKRDSDGAIGDTNHQNRASDHNPWVDDSGMGVVTAMDITHDPEGGCDAAALAAAIRESRDPRVKYIIWNRRICNSSPVGGVAAWAWRTYSGKSPHDHHVHVSVKSEKAAYDSQAEWALP
jgi:hypothetical protein